MDSGSTDRDLADKCNMDSDQTENSNTNRDPTDRNNTYGCQVDGAGTIRPRTLYPGVFTSPYVSSLKCGTIFRVRLC
jgi:hypothetical protein